MVYGDPSHRRTYAVSASSNSLRNISERQTTAELIAVALDVRRNEWIHTAHITTATEPNIIVTDAHDDASGMGCDLSHTQRQSDFTLFVVIAWVLPMSPLHSRLSLATFTIAPRTSSRTLPWRGSPSHVEFQVRLTSTHGLCAPSSSSPLTARRRRSPECRRPPAQRTAFPAGCLFEPPTTPGGLPSAGGASSHFAQGSTEVNRHHGNHDFTHQRRIGSH